nr:B3 domain-containing protein VP1 [Lolium perenne]
MDASAGSSPPPHSQENPPKRAGGRGKAPAGEIRKGHASVAAADDFMFEEDTFPSLPDFPCLSSPSSSTFSSSSSSNSSTAFAAAGRGRGRAAAAGAARDPSETAAGDDDMLEDIDELLNFATLSDSMPWEDEPLFPDDVGMMIEDAISTDQPPATGHGGARNAASEAAASGGAQEDSSSPADDLPRFFMEWLTNNRDCISAEDLRSIRLRRSTIEAAAARLGGGRQGTMQLLKLILTWVQNHHLQKKRPRVDDELHSPGANPGYEFPAEAGAAATSWPMPYQQPYGGEAIYPFQQSGSTSSQPFSPPAADMQAANMPWPQQYAPFPGAASYPMPTPVAVAAPGFGVCPQRMAGTEPSASKEARKKRMARQRRLSCLQQQRSQQLNLGQIHTAMIHPQQEAFSPHSAHSAPVTPSSSGGWGGLWPPPAVQLQGQGQLMVQVPNPLSTKSNSSSRQKQQKPSPDAAAQQGAKPAAADKNLRFLLQKVLKQSDVGALGRIVLPKKEAETHLPELKSRDGISIPMEDIGTSQVWSMRYRFWPNNKSRMYLLENTGDFVRMNDLQEGDFIVIYSDVKSGKYLIRGVKVRPMVHDQAKHKHGTYDLNNVGVEDGGATEAGSCKGKSPHRVRRSSQEAASMNQMAVST